MAATPQYLAELGAMIDQDRFEEVYDKLKRPDGDYSNMDLELMWRLARACRFLVLTKGRTEKKMKDVWIEEGLKVMKAAVDKYPKECLSNTEEGIKNKIKLSYEIREYFDKGYAANPKNYFTLHCLGCWCYEVASLSKVERVFATTFFGKPPESTFEEALRFFLEANKAEGGHAYTVARIAQCYGRLGSKEMAKQWASKAITLHCKDSDIEEAMKDCQRILK